MKGYGKDYHYAGTRLGGSLIRKKDGSPVMVDYVNEDTGEVLVYNHKGKESKVHLDDLDINPVKLGYCNSENSAAYFSRIPARRYRQGLRQENLGCKKKHSRNFFVPLNSKSMANCIRGLYPTLDLCIEKIENMESNAVAWCRDFAVGPKEKMGYCLYYKGDRCGWIDLNKKIPVFSLNKDKNYLKELLECSLNVG